MQDYRIEDASNKDKIEINIANFISPNFQSFVNQPNNNLCIDVWNGQVNEGHIQLWPCHDGDNKKWYMDPLGQIRSKADTNKCIVARKAENQLAKLWVTTYNSQKWRMDTDGCIHSKLDSNKCLDFEGLGFIYDCVNGKNGS